MKCYLKSILTFISLLAMDQITKTDSFIESTGLLPIANPGIIFGQLSQAEPLIRTIFFSCLFVLILILALFVHFYFLKDERLQKISLSFSVFMAGITGNGVDRIRLGYIIDFFPLGNFVLNLADFLQITGALFFVFFLLTHFHILWPKNNERAFRFIDTHFQLSFSLKLSIISLFAQIMTGAFAWSFLKVYLSSFDENQTSVFILSWLIITLLLMVLSFFFGLLISNRVAGPIYAFERFIKDVKAGKKVTLKLRSNDSFKQLEKLADEISELAKK